MAALKDVTSQVDETEAGPDRSRGLYVQSLDRGLAVIRSFSEDSPRLTIADVARKTGLTRAAARRFLHTLQALGYVGSSNGEFHLRPRVLELGYAYLSSMSVADVVQEHLVTLAEELHESCSAAVLDGEDIVYVARAQTNRIMTIALSVGTRLPAHTTSMGRVLLAALPEPEREAYLSTVELRRATPKTVTDREALRALLEKIDRQGYAIIDQELEMGVRSVAVPIHQGGQVVAAVNASAHASRVDMRTLRDRFLPRLRAVAERIDADLGAAR